MDLNEQTFAMIAECLEKTLSPDPNIRRPAERSLETLESRERYGILLLMLCNKTDLQLHIRISAAITFKNFIKRNWRVDEDEQDRIAQQDRQNIKSSIVELMLTSPEQIQKQLSDAISIISKEDFPDKWPNLLTDMVAKMKTGDFHIINGVLRTAHSIFKRFQTRFDWNNYCVNPFVQIET
jgi:exportin-2 (importin alpha re-exporter)